MLCNQHRLLVTAKLRNDASGLPLEGRYKFRSHNVPLEYHFGVGNSSGELQATCNCWSPLKIDDAGLRSKLAADRERSKALERAGDPAGALQGEGNLRAVGSAFDFDVEHVRLRLAGDGSGDDAGEAYPLAGERAEETVEAPALVAQRGDERRAGL